MSNTPETDACWDSLNDYADIDLRVMAEHARRMERERNKANKDAAMLADRLSGLELRTTSELARLEKERDEARDKAVKAWEENIRLDNEAIKTIDMLKRDLADLIEK